MINKNKFLVTCVTENDRIIREAHDRQCSAYLLISRRTEKEVRG